MLAIILSISTILFNQTKIISNVGSSLSSFYAADSGLEKTYYLKKVADSFCNICAVCSDCANCALTPLTANGCLISSCNNCKLTYSSTFDNRTYDIDAKITTNSSDPIISVLNINSKGDYKNTIRVINLTQIQTKVSSVPVYRLYNSQTGDHFYTTSDIEKDSVVRTGYMYEGIGFYAFDSQVSLSVPVHRLYNSKTGDHFYTTSAIERDSVVRTGYMYEGIGFYAFDSQVSY